MITGRVKGEVVSTVKHSSLEGRKMLIVEKTYPDGKGTGDTVIAVDFAQAGIGDHVLIIDEGNSARMILGDKMAPMRCVIAGIIDSVNKEI